MERREFLKYVFANTAILVGQAGRSFGISQNTSMDVPPKQGYKARVSLAAVFKGASEKDMKSAVRAAAESATDFSWLSKRDSVFIKPVLNSGNRYPATTSPAAIGAMIGLLRQKGARRMIVGDMSGIEHVKLSPGGLAGSTRRLMEASGMAQAVQEAGGEMHFFEEAGWKAFYEDAPVPGTHWKGALMMPRILEEVDHIILMPRCARHVLAGSHLVARIGNYYIVNKLGGWGPMLVSEKFTKNDLNSIWDDRVLNRAYHVLGGTPSVALEAANRDLPVVLKKQLIEKIRHQS